MLEWLSQDISLQDSPLSFDKIKIVTQYNDLAQDPPGPRVVIVDDLEFHTNSFAYQAFLDFKSSGHLLLLTSQSVSTTSLTHTLLQQWQSISPTISSPRPIVNVSLNMNVDKEQRIPLQGDELSQWRKTDKANRDLKDAELFFEERQRNILEGDESDSEEDEEDQLLLDTELHHEQPIQRIRGSAILLQEGTYDFWLGDVEGARSSLKHFPFVDKKKKFDDFGVTFKPDEFTRVEDELVPISTRSTKESGGKRKWGEVEIEVEDIPARVVKSTMAIEINVRVGYVDLEGLHDGRAAGNLLPRLNARKMVPQRFEEN